MLLLLLLLHLHQHHSLTPTTTAAPPANAFPTARRRSQPGLEINEPALAAAIQNSQPASAPSAQATTLSLASESTYSTPLPSSLQPTLDSDLDWPRLALSPTGLVLRSTKRNSLLLLLLLPFCTLCYTQYTPYTPSSTAHSLCGCCFVVVSNLRNCAHPPLHSLWSAPASQFRR